METKKIARGASVVYSEHWSSTLLFAIESNAKGPLTIIMCAVKCNMYLFLVDT